jgi:hypothetical protein
LSHGKDRPPEPRGRRMRLEVEPGDPGPGDDAAAALERVRRLLTRRLAIHEARLAQRAGRAPGAGDNGARA